MKATFVFFLSIITSLVSEIESSSTYSSISSVTTSSKEQSYITRNINSVSASDWNEITTESDLTSSIRSICVVTTAALPWMVSFIS